MRYLLLSLLAFAMPISAAEPQAADYRADALSVEALVNANYAYLERLPGGHFTLSAKLKSEAEGVASREQLTRFCERALSLLADHHAITGSSFQDSWALIPSYADLWVERQGDAFIIEAVRAGSPAEAAGIRMGDRLVAIAGLDIGRAVAGFWADLGTSAGSERDAYAARVLAAGRRDRLRDLTIASPGKAPRRFQLSTLYAVRPTTRQPVTVIETRAEYRIRLNDSLGENDTIPAFDAAMARASASKRLIIDLRDTGSGGNTVVARAILGWFVSKPEFYQVHNLPAEERETGITRQWVEQVLPRAGKHWRAPVSVQVGRWTGSMGEGLAIGFDAIGARVEGDRMAGLLGAIYDFPLERTGMVVKFPAERLFTPAGLPRERFVPKAAE